MVNRPNLFVVGAMKSGTTALHELLAVHPQVSMTEPKEPCRFVPPDVLKTDWPEMWRMAFWKDESSYLRLFRDKPLARYFGESSTDYSKLPRISGVAQAIRAYSPDARIIYVMRDPVERTISHYWHMVEHRAETRSLASAVAEEPQYTEVSHYSLQLAPYLQLFGEAQVYAFTSEELRRDGLKAVQALYRWLGISADFVPPDIGRAHNATADEVAQKRHGRIWLDRFRDSALWERTGPLLPRRLRQLGRNLVEKRVTPRDTNVREVMQFLRPLQRRQTEDLVRLLGRDFAEWTTLYGGGRNPD